MLARWWIFGFLLLHFESHLSFLLFRMDKNGFFERREAAWKRVSWDAPGDEEERQRLLNPESQALLTDTEQVQVQIDEVSIAAHDNIDRLLRRGENLTELQGKAGICLI